MYWRGPIGTGLIQDDPYTVLDVPPDCKDSEIKKAYKRKAMQHHPDKGGNLEQFLNLQRAYALVSNPRQRAMHDSMRQQREDRVINNGRQRNVTEEERSENVDYLKQQHGNKSDVPDDMAVVLTCDLCGNVAFDVCYACNSNVCQYCVLRPHYTTECGPHYGVRANPEYGKKIERQQHVQKVQKELEAPQWCRSNEERQNELRTLKHCRKTHRDSTEASLAEAMLAWYYAWGQTENIVQLCVWLPMDHIQPENVRFQLEPFNLRIVTNCGTVILDRELSFEADPNIAPDVVYAEHSPFFAAQIVKKNLGQHLTRVFRGDTVGLRCFDQCEHKVSEEDIEHQEDVEVNVRVPMGTQSHHITGVVMAHGHISFELEGWGTWSRHVQDYTYAKHERDRFVDWSGATWTMLNEGDNYCAVQFSLPRFHRRIGDKKDEKKQRRDPRPFFVEDDDPFKLFSMVEARMWTCVQDHYQERELLSKGAEEHLKDFEKAKLLKKLYMIKHIPEQQAIEEDSESVEERQVQLWQQLPTKPLRDWAAAERHKRDEAWAANHSPAQTQEARQASKAAKVAARAAEREVEAAKKREKTAKPKPELTRLQQKLLEKAAQKKLEEENGPKLLYKRAVEHVPEKWATLSSYSWEDSGGTVKIFVSADVQDPGQTTVELKPDFDGFWVGIKDGQSNHCLHVSVAVMAAVEVWLGGELEA
eukprot:TRINITY_DN13767_c0_g1_i5.p1 TRINITY_DN13767_c0_g1~~TRINITY_DN13767_c0_g1_i5.p1  ORF type:complete len:701 (+),score=204.10 TRINITY_DN13767_c0_g1_i5:164-2266(+)